MSQGYNNLNFNNIYRNWLQGQIETANARGLMGGQTPRQIINQDLVRPINNIINQARVDMRNPNRGILMGNQDLVGGGPTSISTPKQLPAVTTGSNIVNHNARIPKVQPRVNTPNVINMYPSSDIKLLTYDPSRKIIDPSLGKQISYRLPNGTYTSDPNLVNIAKQQTIKAAGKSMARAGGITAAVSVPTAILTHRKAIDYYNSILNNPNSTPEQKQLAMVMRTKEYIQMGTEGLGSAAGTAIGTAVTKHPRIGAAVGGALPYALSSGFGHYLDKAFTPAMQQYNFQPYSGSLKNEVEATVSGLGKGNKGKSSGSNNTGGSTGTNGVKGGGKMGSRPTTQAQALALAQQLSGNTPITNQQDIDTQQANTNAINDYISKLQEINQPYIESLQRFADNYGDLYNQNQLYNRRMRDLSAITGSPLWYQSAKDYNPLEVEATKVDLQKKIQDAQAGDLNAINEIMGNLAMAQEMGLSPEAAFANKNLLTAMTMRDRNLTNREIAQLNNAAKLQIALQNAQNRLAVQNLRNQGGMTNALIYAGQYGQPAVGLNQQGLASNVPASYDVMLQSAHNKNNR